MTKGRNQVTNREYDYPNHYNLLSTTNTKGQIKYANKQFCEVTAYELHELETKTQNIICYLSMLKATFKNLGNYTGNRKFWVRMMLNLHKKVK